MSLTEPATRDDAEPSNLEEAIAFLLVAHQQAVHYDREFSASFSSDPSDSYGIQALSESRSAWGIYQYAKDVVESLGGSFRYDTNLDEYTTLVVVTDPHGTDILT